MRKHIPHPVTRHHSAPFTELDIIYGGNETEAIEESLVIARDLRDVLQEGENILYVNTLVNAERLEHMMGKRFDHGARRGRNHFVTYEADGFITRLESIRAIVIAKDVRYLVLNGFELAALTSRHRSVFMAWIRAMRNAGVNIILFTMSCPGRIGTLGALRFSALTITEVGAYLRSSAEAHHERSLGSAKPKDNFDNTTGSEESESDVPFADEPEATKLYAETHSPTYPKTLRPIDPQTQHSDSDLLKTNDLALEMV